MNLTVPFVANIYICFEHLTLEIIRGVHRHDEETHSRLLNKELKEKLSYILKDVLKSPELIKSDGYVRLFSEFEAKRHSYNHPLEKNVYDVTKDWDNVPLAWIVAGKYHKGFKAIKVFLFEVAKLWDKYQKDNTKHVTLSIKRGIKSAHQFKKPSKS